MNVGRDGETERRMIFYDVYCINNLLRITKDIRQNECSTITKNYTHIAHCTKIELEMESDEFIPMLVGHGHVGVNQPTTR